MPAQQYTATRVTTTNKAHPLVKVLHKCILLIWREALDNGWDLCGFRGV